MDFQSKLLDASQDVRFFGTTPPREGASRDDIARAAEQFVGRIAPLGVDAIVVYDVQDESARTAEPRPFPFLPTMDSRAYSQVLERLSGLPTVTYKCVGPTSAEAWERWLEESRSQFGTRFLSLVGRASSRGERSVADGAISLAKATQMAAERGFCVGGVAIAERHGGGRSESQRIIQKARDGCQFFVSQAVYKPEATVRLLRDYARECKESGLEARRVVLTFTPCGSAKTLEFLRWLGVAMDADTESAILGAEDPLAKSVKVCRESLLQIVSEEACKYLALGINAESVSSRKAEADASARLLQVLAEALREKCAA